MRRNLVTVFASIAGSRVLVVLVSAAVTPLLVRILGFDAYGSYATVMAVFGLLMILVSSGINSGVRKYMAEDGTRDLEDWTDHVFAYYFRLAGVLALLGAGGVLAGFYLGVLDPLIGEVPAGEFAAYVWLLAALVFAAQFREYARRALMGLELEHVSEPLRVLHKVAFGVFAVGLAIALRNGVVGVLVGHVLASTLVFAVAFAAVRRHISIRALLAPLPDAFPDRELLTFNHLTVVYIFLLTSMYHVDVLLLQGFVGGRPVGHYRAALVLVQFLWLVPRSVQSVLIQEVSTLWAEGELAVVDEIATRSTRYIMLLVGVMAVGLGALAPRFVPLYYGPESAPLVAPLILLLPGTLAFAVARPLLAINHAKGDMGVVVAGTGAAAGINLGLNLLLIPRFGMVGAAVATTIGYGSLPLFQAAGARRLGYRPFVGARLGRVALTALGGGGLVVLLARTVPGWVALVVVPPVGLLGYSLLALATGAVGVREVLDLLERVPEPVGSRAAGLRARVDDGTWRPDRGSALAFWSAVAAAVLGSVAGVVAALP